MNYEQFVKKSRQRYLRGMKVHVAKDMPPNMKHFENDYDAIIMGSYVDQFGSQLMTLADDRNYRLYSVAKLDEAGEHIVNTFAWYDESLLKLLDPNIYEGILLLQQYGK